MNTRSRQAGFTLVEIAIVLVIVGLMLGATLKGQELIFNSRVKATYNMSRELSAAVAGYSDRYRQIPGDDNQAAARFPNNLPVPTSGNGDGSISATTNTTCAATTTDESCQAILHLRAAGFVSGAGVAAAVTPLGMAGIITSTGNYWTWGGPAPSFVVGGMTNRGASALDTTFDDGDPRIGSIRVRDTAAYNMTLPDQTINWFIMGL